MKKQILAHHPVTIALGEAFFSIRDLELCSTNGTPLIQNFDFADFSLMDPLNQVVILRAILYEPALVMISEGDQRERLMRMTLFLELLKNMSGKMGRYPAGRFWCQHQIVLTTFDVAPSQREALLKKNKEIIRELDKYINDRDEPLQPEEVEELQYVRRICIIWDSEHEN